jgi:hypothetical protein
MTEVRDEVGPDSPVSAMTFERERERWLASAASAPPPLGAQFVVRESGRIGFVAQFVAHAPAPSSFTVSALAFTLAPRNRSFVRRIVVVDGRMPDVRMTELPRAYVDRIGSAKELIADLGCAIHARGDLRLSSAIELARGTYAIAAHRDHVHLLYELEPRTMSIAGPEDDLGALLADLRIAPRGSLLTAICALGSHGGRVRSVGPFEPALLNREGVELVFGSRPAARSTGNA